MAKHELCERLHIHPAEIEARKQFLRLTPADEENLKTIRQAIQKDIPGLTDAFYAHLAGFAELERFIGQPETLGRLKEDMRRYLSTLGEGTSHEDYFESRLRIGLAHEQVGLAPKWYMGALCRLFELIGDHLRQTSDMSADRLATLTLSLQKVFMLDAALAVEAYGQSARRRLEGILQTLAETQQELKEAARIDSLTRVNNRKHLMEALQAEFDRSRRFGHPLTLMFVDLDRFKLVNDTHGHAFGDFVLRLTVQLIQSVLRPADIIGRFGGEEFVVGLVMTDTDDGRKIAERVRQAVEVAEFTQDETTISLTISVGLATLSSEIGDFDDLLNRADQAMYGAKKSGRNQVAVNSA